MQAIPIEPATEPAYEPVIAIPAVAKGNLRRSIIMAACVGVIVLVSTALLGHFFMGVFACVGLALGAMNSRMVQNAVLSYGQSQATNKKALFTRSILARLGVVTVIALGCAYFIRPDGFRCLRGPRVLPDADARRRLCAGLPAAALMSGHILANDINPGLHHTWDVFGLTFNVDTILSTIIAGVIVIGLGLMVARKASARKPTGAQLAFEAVTDQVEAQVESTLGIKNAPFVVPLAMALFLFILIANWLSVIPTPGDPEYLPPAAADINFTLALAAIVILTMHFVGVRRKGFGGYYHHLFKPSWVLFPINLIEELAKPVTLALRLFGNIFSGTIMISLIALFPAYILWAPNVVWKTFDLFIGAIQAFIFALLTVLYFASIVPEPEGASAH